MRIKSSYITLLSSALLVTSLLTGTCLTAGEMVHQQSAAAVVQDDTDPHAHHRAKLAEPQSGQDATASVQLHDRPLLTQDGKQVSFASDVIQDHIVVMNFVYTTCTTVCPVLSAVFKQVQNRLGDRLGDEILLVSVSVDPGRDTPRRLKAYADRQQARPGWVWLTGEKIAVDQVLDGLGAYTPDFEDHPSMVLVGDARTGQWTRFFGFPGPDQLLAVVDELAMARHGASARQSIQE
jgi:protein SCO1/2